MEKAILVLDWGAGLLWVYSNRIEIQSGDPYYSGTLNKNEMVQLRNILNRVLLGRNSNTEELPETD